MTTPRRHQQRRALILSMQRSGATLPEMAEQLGLSMPGRARKVVQWHLSHIDYWRSKGDTKHAMA